MDLIGYITKPKRFSLLLKQFFCYHMTGNLNVEVDLCIQKVFTRLGRLEKSNKKFLTTEDQGFLNKGK